MIIERADFDWPLAEIVYTFKLYFTASKFYVCDSTLLTIRALCRRNTNNSSSSPKNSMT